MWYGVDALAEKYPNMGGYVYCAGNPVKLIDPDGREGVVSITEDGTIVVSTIIVYSKNELDAYNKKMGENYTLEHFQNDVDIAYNKNNFTIDYNNKKYNVKFNIQIREENDEYIDETKLPEGYSKLTFKHDNGAGASSGNSIVLKNPRLSSEAKEKTTGLTLSHEVGHTLGLKDTHEVTSGYLMSYSENRSLHTDEVELLLKPTFESGFKQTKIGRRNKNEKAW